MLPDGEGGSDEVFIERNFPGNKRTLIRQIAALIDHVKNVVFIQVRSQRKEPALERAIFPWTAGGCFAVEKIDGSMPAVWKLVILGMIFFPVQPVLFSAEHLLVSGEQINTKIVFRIEISGIGFAAAGAACSAAKLTAVLIQRRNPVEKSIYCFKCVFCD